MARPPDPALRMFWTRLIRDFDSTQLSVAQYCRNSNVSVASFYQWKRRLSADSTSSMNTSAFVPLNIKPSASISQTCVQIELGNDCRIDVPQHCEALVLQIVRLVLKTGSDLS